VPPEAAPREVVPPDAVPRDAPGAVPRDRAALPVPEPPLTV
jgi:hypothetical protein